MGGHQQNVRFFPEQVLRLEWLCQIHSHHLNLTVLDQRSGERFSQQSILSGNEDAWLTFRACDSVYPCGVFQDRDICQAVTI